MLDITLLLQVALNDTFFNTALNSITAEFGLTGISRNEKVEKTSTFTANRMEGNSTLGPTQRLGTRVLQSAPTNGQRSRPNTKWRLKFAEFLLILAAQFTLKIR